MSGMAIQPLVRAAADRPRRIDMCPWIAARAVIAAMTASMASCERRRVCLRDVKSSHGALAWRRSMKALSASGRVRPVACGRCDSYPSSAARQPDKH